MASDDELPAAVTVSNFSSPAKSSPAPKPAKLQKLLTPKPRGGPLSTERGSVVHELDGAIVGKFGKLRKRASSTRYPDAVERLRVVEEWLATNRTASTLAASSDTPGAIDGTGTVDTAEADTAPAPPKAKTPKVVNTAVEIDVMEKSAQEIATRLRSTTPAPHDHAAGTWKEFIKVRLPTVKTAVPGVQMAMAMKVVAIEWAELKKSRMT